MSGSVNFTIFEHVDRLEKEREELMCCIKNAKYIISWFEAQGFPNIRVDRGSEIGTKITQFCNQYGRHDFKTKKIK